VHLEIPDNSRDIHAIQLSGESWRPADLIPNNLDPRNLTVKFYGASTSGKKLEADWETGIKLVAFSLRDEISVTESQLGLDLYFKCSDQLSEKLNLYIHCYHCDTNPVNLFIADFKRKLINPNIRFQVDRELILDRFSPELNKASIEIPLPEKISFGKYSVFAGLYPETGPRLKVIGSNQPVYRNGIFLSEITIMVLRWMEVRNCIAVGWQNNYPRFSVLKSPPPVQKVTSPGKMSILKA